MSRATLAIFTALMLAAFGGLSTLLPGSGSFEGRFR